MAPDGDGIVPVRRALLSTFDPTGLVEFARSLTALSVDIVATSGTAAALARGGVPSRPAEELTGIGDWFGGRIKTLHPGLLGGLLAPRTPEGAQELADHRLLPIDLVAVNFYPFARRYAEDPTAADLVEMIDVGGVTLARAAAKNHPWVAVLTDPADYPSVAAELAERSGGLAAATRRALALRTFDRVAAYDAEIARGLAGPPASGGGFPPEIRFVREPLVLRYGENPHQAAAAYRRAPSSEGRIDPSAGELVKGDGLSFNNLLDLDTALATVAEFPGPAVAVVKHATPVGASTAPTIEEALTHALETDPVARYGGIIAANRPIGAAAPPALRGVFVDLLAATGFDPAARPALDRRSKLKLVRVDLPRAVGPSWEARGALGRLLLQEVDRRPLVPGELVRMTSHTATPEELASLDFAWRVVRHAKSSAVVLARGTSTVGIGSGQAARVTAVEIATRVAGDLARGSVLASDAFFPFADGVELAARAGVRAIVQPGGSVRDAEVIAAAEAAGIAMYRTGWRVFRH